MSMRFPEFLRTTTFRWTLTISAVFVAAMLVLVAAIYHETVASNEARTDETMIQDVGRTVSEGAESAAMRVHARLMKDPRRVRLGGLFDADRKLVAGNMHSFPEGFKADDKVWDIVVEREDSQGLEVRTARAVGGILRDGSTYIVGRNFDDFVPLQESMMQTLALGLAPAIGLALFCGIILSMRTQRRIEEIHRMAERIMAGHLNERLPGRGKNDDFDKLVDIINAMLGQIEHLISEVKGVGDDIAHDLRTPLTRVRAALERGRDHATSLEDLRTAVDKGLNGIDQALGVTTALLRIAAIEHGQRNAGFGEVDLGTGGVADSMMHGDRDLLFEAISNLVDNAIKFTPAGGNVSVDLIHAGERLLLRVSDSGPGIPVPEREAVFRRFYQSDKSRTAGGMGLGLSLVAAISRLHGFTVRVADTLSGCTIEMVCEPQAA